MSLILKGIDLPKHCEAVEVKFCISDIDVYRYTYVEGHRDVSAVFTGEELDNIVQIPKGHGRLKDFDADGVHPVIVDGEYMVRVDDLDELPTILEAEE